MHPKLPLPATTSRLFGLGAAADPGLRAALRPDADYLWQPGYWGFGPFGFFWVPGTWVQAPQPGYLWTPGYWGFGNGRYGWHAAIGRRRLDSTAA